MTKSLGAYTQCLRHSYIIIIIIIIIIHYFYKIISQQRLAYTETREGGYNRPE
jgi:hypothetical protein